MKRLVHIYITVLLFSSCSSGGDGEVEAKVQDPEKTILVFPENNSECIEGQVVNSKESSVTFEWNTAKYTDSYEISVKNLISGSVKKYSSSSTKLDITINRGVPYSWFVTSKSKKTNNTTKSDIWKFYNAGAATVSHIPFPADVVEPVNGSSVSATNGAVTLKWEGNDLDNDIASYDVYFGENNPPEQLFQSNVSSSQLSGVNVESGKLYYWSVVTKDETGNVSNSDIFYFNVD